MRHVGIYAAQSSLWFYSSEIDAVAILPFVASSVSLSDLSKSTEKLIK